MKIPSLIWRLRPIVISPIRNRIVQRAILNILQNFDPIKPYFEVPTSFGGISERGRENAIRMVYDLIEKGHAKYFIRSDIKSFFTKIPKANLYSIIQDNVDDKRFLPLFSEAISTEIINLEQLGEKRNLFPLYEIGVAQGSCLSPLMGNIVLTDFDKKMNTDDVTCIRYIDDFIILAPTSKILKGSFKKALKILEKLGMDAYRPGKDQGKCEYGPTNKMFTFLGCDIRPGMIRPSRESKNRLLTSLKKEINTSKSKMDDPHKLVQYNLTFLDTLSHVSNTIRGWGGQYSFCNDHQLMG